MLKVGMMDPGSHLIIKGKIIMGNYSQSPQSKDQVSGFLMDVLTRLIEFSNQGSTEGQGESVDLNQSTKESKDSNSVDTGTQVDLTVNKVSIYPSVSLVLGKPDPSGVLVIGNGANQEEKPAQKSDRCLFKSISSLKGVVLGGPLNKEEATKLIQGNPVLPNRDQKLVLTLDPSPVDGTYVTAQEPEEVKSGLINPNKQTAASGLILKESSNKEERIINGTGYTLRLNRGEQQVLSSAQSIVDEIPIQAQESKDTKPDFINPNKQAAVEGVILKEPPENTENLNFTLESYLPENILKRFAAKLAQTLIDGTSGKTVNSGEKDSKFKKLMEQSSDKVLVKTESLPNEIIKEKDTKQGPSSASIEIDKTEGQP